MAPSTAALSLTDVSKSFGATQALKSITMSVRAGTIHALVGENGAGKSTALGILAGRIPATSGQVEVFGSTLRGGDPRASRAAGIVAIYQELTILPALTAEANVFLGQTLSKAGFLSNARMRQEYEALCERIGVRAVPPRVVAGSLSVAEQQLLEIMRALVSDARVVLLDEPSASLALSEREALHRLVRNLKASGVTIVFVSHNLDEVLDLADDITVFRDGELAVSEDREHFTKPLLVRSMIGDKGDSRIVREMLEGDEAEVAQRTHDEARVSRLARSQGRAPVLSAKNVCVPGMIDNLEIEIRAGEIVGIGGLVGSGRSTLLRALAGLEPKAAGQLFIDGKEVRWPKSVKRALKYGIALVPEDRKGQGLVLAQTAADNIAISKFRKVSKFGFTSTRSVVRGTDKVAQAFGFRADRLRFKARQLSGGNQQKLLLARWQFQTPRVLLADEPTRGVDVGAKAEILASLEGMAREGLALVLVSSELEEVAVASDRVYVLAEGELVGHIDRDDAEITSAAILDLAFKVHESA